MIHQKTTVHEVLHRKHLGQDLNRISVKTDNFSLRKREGRGAHCLLHYGMLTNLRKLCLYTSFSLDVHALCGRYEGFKSLASQRLSFLPASLGDGRCNIPSSPPLAVLEK